MKQIVNLIFGSLLAISCNTVQANGFLQGMDLGGRMVQQAHEQAMLKRQREREARAQEAEEALRSEKLEQARALNAAREREAAANPFAAGWAAKVSLPQTYIGKREVLRDNEPGDVHVVVNASAPDSSTLKTRYLVTNFPVNLANVLGSASLVEEVAINCAAGALQIMDFSFHRLPSGRGNVVEKGSQFLAMERPFRRPWMESLYIATCASGG